MTIFVQIAAYRDPQLGPTIDDMLASAEHPAQLRVAICRQYSAKDRPDGVSRYRRDRRFVIIDIPASDSQGVCWARRRLQVLYSGERYGLQIDSHMRFGHHWDAELTAMLAHLRRSQSRKPILTGFPAPFEPRRPLFKQRGYPVLRTIADEFTADGVLLTKAEEVKTSALRAPLPAMFLSGGFLFTPGQFCREVPYDPHLYFHGEEISLSARAFTHGYDFFHPHKTLLWHYYGRAGARKHWDDHPAWSALDDVSARRVRRLLMMEKSPPAEPPLGAYGLGRARTLADFERHCGISFAKQWSSAVAR